MARYSKEEIKNGIDGCLRCLKPGKTVYTILRRRSSSGMSRHISLVIIDKDYNGKPVIFDLTWWAAQAMDYRLDRDTGGIVVSGCGMDMGFHLVYSLGRKLFPKGFKLPKGQPGRNGDTSGRDNDGGYALKHTWL